MKKWLKNITGITAKEQELEAKELEVIKVRDPKAYATRKKEPWVNVLDMQVNEDNIRNGFFELDWNKYFIEELIKNHLYHKIWQAYAGLLPIKTVGVMGDSRTYEYICLLRAVTSNDGMTADYFNFPKNFLDRISNKIVNNVKGINRVVYDITSKPPSTIELE